MLPQMRQVSPCNSYRFRFAGETDGAYVARLAKELEAEIVAAGPHNVCAFIAETVVGAVSALFNIITLPAASKGSMRWPPDYRLCASCTWLYPSHP